MSTTPKAKNQAKKRGIPGGGVKESRPLNTPRRAKVPRPSKRRSKAEMERLRANIYAIAQEDHPVTVRQLYYRLVSTGEIPKTELAYKGIVKQSTNMRLAGELPFTWIADETRRMRKPRTYDGLTQCLQMTAEHYRRDLWAHQDVYVEIWCEKEALAGVMSQETMTYDVPLMVCRGYPSLSFVYGAANAIAQQKKQAVLYYFGDYDPSGCDISRHLEQRLRELAPTADIEFRRVAVLAEQIEQWGLETRPTKRTDSRAKDFAGESVELDAIMPRQLRALTRDCIEPHLDQRTLKATKSIEAAERESLRRVAKMGGMR